MLPRDEAIGHIKKTIEKTYARKGVDVVRKNFQAVDTTLANLLQAAHEVDGVVKGLQSARWPREPWQALHRLAQSLCAACGGAVARR